MERIQELRERVYHVPGMDNEKVTVVPASIIALARAMMLAGDP
jgi:hypothetical protein